MRRTPAAFEISENFTMSTVRGGAMKAAFTPWRPMVALESMVAQVLASSGCAAELPVSIKRLCIELRYTDRNRFELADCHFEDPKEAIYRPCIHLDGRHLHEGMRDEERFWTLWWLCLDALIHVADRFSLPATVRKPLLEARERAIVDPPWPPVPEAPHAETASSLGDASPPSPPRLPHDAGELWVHIQGDAGDAIIEALCEMVATRKLGEWSGDSHGSGSSDVSFDVEDMHRAGEEISSYLREAWPGTRFLVSERYEPEAFPG